MDVESKKSYNFGFVMKESDLRRLVDTISEQFRKLESSVQAQKRFSLKFKNGAIADNLSIDEVLAQENSGSGRIIRLYYEEVLIEGGSPPTRVSIEFINLDAEEERGNISVKFAVHGHDRDWVFVTSSLLDERIDRLKRFALNQLGETPRTKVAFKLLSLVFPLVLLLVMMFSAQSSVTRLQTGNNGAVDRIESRWKAGDLKDPVEAIIILDRERIIRERDFKIADVLPLKLIGGAIAGLVVLGVLFLFLLRYYPVYNFCWGEYLETFTRREAARRFWLIVILVGFVVSFVASLAANRIH